MKKKPHPNFTIGSGPILVIGAGGILGNAMLHEFTRRGLQAVGTVRKVPHSNDPWFSGLALLPDVDLRDPNSIESAFEATRPAWVVNCTAARNADASGHASLWAINTEAPHRLAEGAASVGARLVHISTDGVFDGTSAPYNELSRPSPIDPYGASKLAGEPDGDHVLTLRLSLIGRSPAGHGTLVDWLLSLPPDAEISGFARAVFSGLPVHRIVRFLAEEVIGVHSPPNGLMHVAGPPISKADLIRLIVKRAGRVDVRVTNDYSVVIDRTLASVRWSGFGDQSSLSWSALVDEMFDFYARRRL